MMERSRLKPVSLDAMSPEQRRAAQALLDGPRRAIPGPFHALLRSPELADRVRSLGDYVRFANSLPPRLCELVILRVARYWTAQYEWFAHRRLSAELGLAPSVADAIAAGRRPEGLAADELLGFDFVDELLKNRDVSDLTYNKALERFGERGIVDLVSIAGYFSLVSLVLNTERHEIPEDAVPLRTA